MIIFLTRDWLIAFCHWEQKNVLELMLQSLGVYDMWKLFFELISRICTIAYYSQVTGFLLHCVDMYHMCVSMSPLRVGHGYTQGSECVKLLLQFFAIMLLDRSIQGNTWMLCLLVWQVHTRGKEENRSSSVFLMKVKWNGNRLLHDTFIVRLILQKCDYSLSLNGSHTKVKWHQWWCCSLVTVYYKHWILIEMLILLIKKI